MAAQRWHLGEEGRDKDPTQGRRPDTSPSPAAIITSDLIILMGTGRGEGGRRKAEERGRHFFSGKGFS